MSATFQGVAATLSCLLDSAVDSLRAPVISAVKGRRLGSQDRWCDSRGTGGWRALGAALWLCLPTGVRVASTRGLVRLLSFTCGVTIANVYYAQPLSRTIAHGLGAGQSAAGLIVAATQLG